MLIHKRVIQALTVAVGDPDDTRYGLDGIYVDADGVAVATDGHLLLYTRTPATIPPDEYPSTPTSTTTPIDAAASVDGQTVPIKALQTAAKHVRGVQPISACDHVVVTPNETSLRVVAVATGRGAVTVSDQHVEPAVGEFPAWERVLPKHPTTLTVWLSARMLADLAKAAKAVGGKGDLSAVTFEFTNEGNAEPAKGYQDAIGVKLTSADGHDVGGVVMPMQLV